MKARDSQTETLKDVYVKALDSNEVGTILPFAGTTAPTSYMFCDGSAISRTTYADLFAKIGTSFGAGDGSTTFNLPDLSGKVPVGLDENDTDFDTIGETGGSKYLQEHQHKYKNTGGEFAGTVNNTWTGGGTQSGVKVNDTATTTGNVYNITTGNSGNLQPYVVINYIIKVSNNRPRTSQTINVESNSTTDAYSCDYSNKRNTYSTDETFTGKYWIDGKPIYRKVLQGGSVSASSVTNINTGVNNIMLVINQEGYGLTNSGATFPLNRANGSSFQYQSTFFFDKPNNRFSLETGSSVSFTSYYIIMEYTKTN